MQNHAVFNFRLVNYYSSGVHTKRVKDVGSLFIILSFRQMVAIENQQKPHFCYSLLYLKYSW